MLTTPRLPWRTTEMSRSARLRFEDSLESVDLAALRRCCDMLGVAFHLWRRVSWLRVHFETVAIEAVADRIQEQRPGSSRGEAHREACADLGVPLGTHHQRRQRARRDAVNPQGPEIESDILSPDGRA